MPGIYVKHPNDGQQFSQELRLSNDDEQLRWTAGIYYFDRSIEAGSNIDVSGIGLFNLLLQTDDDIESWAGFGQLEYALTDSVTLIGGLRYTYEERHFEQLSRDLTGVIPVFLGVSPTPVPGYVTFDFTDETVGDLTKTEDDSVTFRAEVDWRPVEDLLLYASISRGTKGAGFNSAFDGTGVFSGSTVEQIPFDEETLTDYEVGFKSTIFGGTTNLNASIFYYDYDDYQAFTFDNITQVIRNCPPRCMEPNSTSLHVRQSPGTSRAGSRGCTPKSRTSPLRICSRVNRSCEIGRWRWRRSSRSRRLARYQWDMFGGRMSVQASGQYQSEMFFDLDNNPVTKEDGYATLDLRVAYTDAAERFEVACGART